jgi:hypothetical protein
VGVPDVRIVVRRLVRYGSVPVVSTTLSLSVLGLALSTVAVSWAARWADHAAVDTTTRLLAVEGANVGALGLVWLGQFVLLDRVLFHQAV